MLSCALLRKYIYLMQLVLAADRGSHDFLESLSSSIDLHDNARDHCPSLAFVCI